MLFQIDGDGKQMIVPAYRERILFEQEMYIAGHNFTNEAGWKVREVYFWIGDEVLDAEEGFTTASNAPCQNAHAPKSHSAQKW